MKDRIIDIFGTTYTIKFVDKIDSDNKDDFVEGICESADCSIRVTTKMKDGSDMPKSIIEKNLLHELFHAIFNEGQYLDLGSNEPLVEWCARCVHSLIQQKVI